MEIFIGLVILYAVQVVLIYGLTFAYFEGKYSEQGHESFAQRLSLFGAFLPFLGVALIYVLSDYAKYGLRYK